jgi:hypothetical protein
MGYPRMTVSSSSSSKGKLTEAAAYLQKNGYEVNTITEDQSYQVKKTNSQIPDQWYDLQQHGDQYQVTTTIKPDQAQDYYQHLAREIINIAVTCVRSDDPQLDHKDIILDIDLGDSADQQLVEAVADEVANNGYQLDTNNSALSQAVAAKSSAPEPSSSSAPGPTELQHQTNANAEYLTVFNGSSG